MSNANILQIDSGQPPAVIPIHSESDLIPENMQRREQALDSDELKGYLGIQTEQQISKEEVAEQFWEKREKDAKVWLYLVTSSNVFFSLMAMIDPANPDHFKMNLLYTLSSIVHLSLIYATKKYKKHSGSILLAVFMIVIARNIIEILNLDNIKGSSYINEQDYGFDVLIQVTGVFILVILYFNIFRDSKVHLFVVFLMYIFVFYCMIISQYGSDWLDQGIMSHLLKLVILGLYSFLIIIQRSIIQGFLKEIIDKQN